MKKLVSKIRSRKQPKEPVGRITTDTLAEHREKVLAGGRKFKYPVQYARHKLVINAAIIATSALVLLVAVGWYLLYPAQNTSEFMYRVTKVLPVSVAKVDGQPVRYSDYLAKYRSALHYSIEKERIDIKTEDGKRRLDFYKQSSMDDAVADAYAQKLAREHGVKTDAAGAEAVLKQQLRDNDASEAVFAGSIADNYGWTMDEYRTVVAQKLLRRDVSYKIDDKARGVSASIAEAVLAENVDLGALVESLNKDKEDAVRYVPPVWVPKNNQDNGLALAASKLEKGAFSDAIKTSGSENVYGYYHVRLVDSNESQVQYEYAYVPLTAFSERLAEIKKAGRVSYFVSLAEVKDSGTDAVKPEGGVDGQ